MSINIRQQFIIGATKGRITFVVDKGTNRRVATLSRRKSAFSIRILPGLPGADSIIHDGFKSRKDAIEWLGGTMKGYRD